MLKDSNKELTGKPDEPCMAAESAAKRRCLQKVLKYSWVALTSMSNTDSGVPKTLK